MSFCAASGSACIAAGFRATISLLRLLSRSHATPADSCLWCAQRLAAAAAGRAIEREAVVQHRGAIRFLIARYRLISGKHRRVMFRQRDEAQRCAGFLAIFLQGLSSSAKKGCDLGKFLFIEHRHFGFATPTPKPLHRATIIARLLDSPSPTRIS